MPHRNKICGIYSIGTPNGNRYIGSSAYIQRRWSEHKGHLRRGTHHSERLQAAYNKHGGSLIFEVLEECAAEVLNEREQFYFDHYAPALNVTVFVGNVWTNPESKQKLMKFLLSDKNKERIRLSLEKRKGKWWVPVVASDGRTFENMAVAAKAFGIKTTGILQLVRTQHLGRLGVRFRRASEEWRPILTLSEKIIATRTKNGNLYPSEETRARMRKSRRSYFERKWLEQKSQLHGI